jgi:hypothetical protein
MQEPKLSESIRKFRLGRNNFLKNNSMKKIALLLLLVISVGFVQAQDNKNKDLLIYLQNHWKSPEEYVISKFKDHDYVFIGEYHRIKHDVELIDSQ